MNNPIIRLMTPSDIDFGYFLATETEKWDYTLEDFKRLQYYNPDGNFIAEMDGQGAGIITTTVYGNKAWLGTLIVHPGFRGQGIGSILVNHAIMYLESKGVSHIKLDAVKKAISLYERHRFRIESPSLRFTGAGGDYRLHDYERMELKDIPDVIALDKRISGLQRDKVLRRLLTDFPGLAFVKREVSELQGFIMAKWTPFQYKIGPWICLPENYHAATNLLGAVLKEASDSKVWIGIPSKNAMAVAIVKNHGFEQTSSSYRMVRGVTDQDELHEGIFAIGSPEKG
ncbi:MAG: GNAT family N-acetyltransferase [Candidatus Hodarchaeales archaeon]